MNPTPVDQPRSIQHGHRPRALCRRRLALPVVLAACALAPVWLGAQPSGQAWPTKPVTLVIGTPAGGAIDTYARALAQQLGKATGGTFVVDYKPGVNGNISAEHVLKAAPDGHTLWITTQAMLSINPSVYPALRWKQADFKPIAKGVEAPLVLVVHPSVPARTLPELARWVSAQAGKAAYASYSPGTPSHFLGFQLNERLKADMVHIPYKGSAPHVTDLVGGQVLLGFSQLQTALPHLQSGKLNAIAVTSPERSRYLPQVPTLAEQGMRDLSTTIWFGVAAPAAAPQPTLAAIETAIVAAHADPDFRSRMMAQGFDVPTEHGEAFARTINTETTRWAGVVRATGFKAND